MIGIAPRSDLAANRAACRRRGIIRENAKNRPGFLPRLLYKSRARVGQTIGELKRFKRIAMRCDKTQAGRSRRLERCLGNQMGSNPPSPHPAKVFSGVASCT